MCRPGPYNAPQRKLLSLRIASKVHLRLTCEVVAGSLCGSPSTNPDIKFVSSPRLCAGGRRAARVPGSTWCPHATSSWTLWEGFPKEFGVLNDLFKVRSHGMTEARELNACDVANEKPTADFFFESLNGCAQRWLCDVAPSGRPGEVQFLAHRKEVSDFAHIHSILGWSGADVVPSKNEATVESPERIFTSGAPRTVQERLKSPDFRARRCQHAI